MAVYLGNTFDAGTDYSGTLPNVSVSLNMDMVDNCVRLYTPIITPFGFHSVPVDNLTAVQAGSSNYNTSVVLGFLNPCSGTTEEPQDNIEELGQGESELFNGFNYTIRMQKEKINVKWKDLETRITNGENDMNLFLEIYAQMNQLINLMDSYWTIFNSHVHPNVDPSIPAQTLPTATPVVYASNAPTGLIVQAQPFFDTIKAELGTGDTIHIDNNGAMFSSYTAEV